MQISIPTSNIVMDLGLGLKEILKLLWVYKCLTRRKLPVKEFNTYGQLQTVILYDMSYFLYHFL
jgi:hypothetical protein